MTKMSCIQITIMFPTIKIRNRTPPVWPDRRNGGDFFLLPSSDRVRNVLSDLFVGCLCIECSHIGNMWCIRGVDIYTQMPLCSLCHADIFSPLWCYSRLKRICEYFAFVSLMTWFDWTFTATLAVSASLDRVGTSMQSFIFTFFKCSSVYCIWKLSMICCS